MSASLVLFYVLGAVCLLAAFGVVTARSVVYAALALLVALMAVAGLYLLVFAQFLTLVQVLIYGGAITIVVLFAIMLTRMDELRAKATHHQWPLAAVAAAAVFGVLGATFLRSTPATGPVQGVGFRELGDSLFSQWAVPFEIASLVLLVALIGAVVLSRSTGGRD